MPPPVAAPRTSSTMPAMAKPMTRPLGPLFSSLDLSFFLRRLGRRSSSSSSGSGASAASSTGAARCFTLAGGASSSSAGTGKTASHFGHLTFLPAGMALAIFKTASHSGHVSAKMGIGSLASPSSQRWLLQELGRLHRSRAGTPSQSARPAEELHADCLYLVEAKIAEPKDVEQRA